ncbi:hypothetical protein OAG06_04950 [Verrucomicrobia bacterium]|nr:hypothetical protein [Verrucomicrobiota bacterium]
MLKKALNWVAESILAERTRRLMQPTYLLTQSCTGTNGVMAV